MLVSAIAYPGYGDDRRRDIEREHAREARSAKRSIWRRELHVFPKRSREVAVFAEAGNAPDAEHSEPKVPWYKRELGPKKKTKKAKPVAEAPRREDEKGAEPKVPWYKREIGRKKKAQPVEVEADSEHTPIAEPTVVDRVLAATQPDEPGPDEAVEPEPTETTPTAAADAWSAFFGDAVVTAESPAQETSAPADVDEWIVEPDPADTVPEVVAERVEPENAEPKVPWYKRELGPKKNKKQDEKSQPVADAPRREDETASAPKVPWYKREIGRSKKAQPVEVDAEREPTQTDGPTAVERILAATERNEPTVEQPVERVAGEPAPTAAEWNTVVDDAAVASEAPAQAGEPEVEAAEVFAEHVEPEAVEPKVPWYKRELGSKKKTKEEKPVAEAPRGEEENGSEPKVPWYKRELGRKKKAKPDVAATKETPRSKPAQPKVPWYKRELGRKKSSAPKSAAPRKQKRQSRRGGGRKQRIVGLKVGGSQLAAARVVNNGSAELVQLARMDLGKGVIVGGELRDPEALTTALKKFFRENKLPRQGVRLGIGSNRIGVRVVDIAGVEDQSLLDNAVRFKAQEFLPIPLEQAVLDYHVVGEFADDEGRLVHRVLVAFAYRELVDRYLDACKRAGIRLSGIDLEAFALLRAIGAPLPADAPPRDAAVIAVALGHDRSTLAVSDGRVCEFTRILEWGGFQLDVAVSRVLDVTPSEAEAVKLQVDLSSANGAIGDLSLDRSQEVRDAVRRQVELLARELVSSLQFYQSQPGSLGVGEIVITGGTAQLPGLAAELTRLIGVNVRLGDPFARVKVGRRVKSDAQLPSLAVAIGLGIED